MKRHTKKQRNSLVIAMVTRHAGSTRMNDRRGKRQGNPKRSWWGEL